MKDRKNIVFLAVGVLLSAVSKLLQFVYQAKIGDLIVIPAAVFFVLAILHSLPAFKALYQTAQGARQAKRRNSARHQLIKRYQEETK